MLWCNSSLGDNINEHANFGIWEEPGKCIRNYHNIEITRRWSKSIFKSYRVLYSMEKIYRLEPSFSQSFSELFDYITKKYVNIIYKILEKLEIIKING